MPWEHPRTVAPRAGAWVETFLLFLYYSWFVVAPRAGAWVETKLQLDKIRQSEKSHPVRVRGLKLVLRAGTNMEITVAPRAGAWVETQTLEAS